MRAEAERTGVLVHRLQAGRVLRHTGWGACTTRCTGDLPACG
jgi:hypothetical protein